MTRTHREPMWAFETMQNTLLQLPDGTETTISEWLEQDAQVEATKAVDEGYLALLFAVTLGGLLS